MGDTNCAPTHHTLTDGMYMDTQGHIPAKLTSFPVLGLPNLHRPRGGCREQARVLGVVADGVHNAASPQGARVRRVLLEGEHQGALHRHRRHTSNT